MKPAKKYVERCSHGPAVYNLDEDDVEKRTKTDEDEEQYQAPTGREVWRTKAHFANVDSRRPEAGSYTHRDRYMSGCDMLGTRLTNGTTSMTREDRGKGQ